jgi:hypothetical protein
MNWFERLEKTPLHFKLLLALLMADCLLSPLSLVPSFYKRGFAHIGNLWWGALVVFFFVFPDSDRGVKVIRSFALAIAVIYSIYTVFYYGMNRGAHADYPWNPSFDFHWFNWVDGIVFPWLIAAICCFLPRTSFPIRPSSQTAE